MILAYNTMCEQNLIQLIKLNKDEQSFKELVAIYEKQLLGFLKNKTFSTSLDPAEIYNKTLLKIWKNIDSFRADSSFKTWIFQITKNVYFDEYNKARKLSSRETSIDFVEESDRFVDNRTPDSRILLDEYSLSLSQKIQTLKNTLGKKQLQIFELIFEQGKSYKEASKTLKCSVGTIESRVFYTRKKLKEVLKKYEYRNAHSKC